MARPSPSADSLDGYGFHYLQRLARDEGLRSDRRNQRQLRDDLKAFYTTKEKEETIVKKSPRTKRTMETAPKRPASQKAAPQATKASAQKVASKPRKLAIKARKKVRFTPNDEQEALDHSSNAYRRLYYLLQHVLTHRSELINEDEGDVLQPSIDALAAVVSALEVLVPVAPQ